MNQLFDIEFDYEIIAYEDILVNHPMPSIYNRLKLKIKNFYKNINTLFKSFDRFLSYWRRLRIVTDTFEGKAFIRQTNL